MFNKQDFLNHLTVRKKNQDYINKCGDLLNRLENKLQGEPPTAEAIGEFVRDHWSGYVSRDKLTYQILSEYADFCKSEIPSFTHAYNKHIRETFEGEARKAMKLYKDFMVFIPPNTKINPIHLNGLTNDEFVGAFQALQEFLYATYSEIEHGSPFDWGWPDWNDLTGYGFIYNRVVMVLNALVENGHAENNILIVDKHRFAEHAKKRADEQLVCKPPEKTKRLLEGLNKTGLHIEGLDDKNIPFFSVSFPKNPNVIAVICSYFKERNTTNHIRYFSYRFIEDPATQSRETFFLAKTDGEPEHVREIYYWLYDEAGKHGFYPTGEEKIYCYLYKKGTKEWLLLGKGSSYHEEEFLHSVNHTLSAKFAFPKIYYTHPQKIEWLTKRFPESFTTRWGGCHRCKEKKGKLNECKHRIIFDEDNPHHRCIRGFFYFHNPTFDDVKMILEMYKLENNIKPI
jgi:hypothetical protein